MKLPSTHPPIEMWGKDHWSTFAYIETLCVDAMNGVGEIVRDRMRTDEDRHPMLVGWHNAQFRRDRAEGHMTKYPTRLKGDAEIADHDDWDCLDDCENAGLLSVFTLTSGYVSLSELGKQVAGELRSHKASGGTFATFNPSKRSRAQMQAARIGNGVRQ